MFLIVMVVRVIMLRHPYSATKQQQMYNSLSLGPLRKLNHLQQNGYTRRYLPRQQSQSSDIGTNVHGSSGIISLLHRWDH